MLIRGDARAIPLRDESVDCVVTSPPYWGLRDYGHAQQIGIEQRPEEYVESLVGVFREVRRVLKPSGTLWLNLGDCYATGAGKVGDHPGGGAQGERWNHHHMPQTPDRKNPHANLTRTQPNRMPLPGLKPKDLVGIPWRVAFALQQPYEHAQMRAHIDRAWLAALTDGEGTITILRAKSPHGSGDSYPPVLQVRMCDPEPLAKAAAITGYGSASPKQSPPSQGGNRPSYQWRLNGRKAADIIAEIYPYLLVKRRQAVVAWNHQRIRDSYETKRGVKIPPDALAKQQLCRDLVRALNRREDVDLPSWMQEPSICIEPGYYLRSDVIWAKPNPMPESVRDRPTKAHEYVFLLSKGQHYCYDADAIREPHKPASLARYEYGLHTRAPQDGYIATSGCSPTNVRALGRSARIGDNINYDGANARSVWSIQTEAYPAAHFAVFPTELAKRCILAGCPSGGLVLDPFVGSGTTVKVARELGRNGIGLDLSAKYLHEQAAQRIKTTLGLGV